MTKEQCESRILALMECIKDTYKQYRGDDVYLSMVIMNDAMDFHNRYYGEDSDFPLSYYRRGGDNRDA